MLNNLNRTICYKVLKSQYPWDQLDTFFGETTEYLLHDLPVSYIFSRWVLTFPGFFGGLGMLQEYVGCNPLGSFLPVLFRTEPLSRTNPNLGENSA